MSTLSSASTLAEIKASYDDNASYEEDASPSKARAFVTACRLLLRYTPRRSREGGGSEIEFDTVRIAEELKAAQAWLATYSGSSGSVRHASFENFR